MTEPHVSCHPPAHAGVLSTPGRTSLTSQGPGHIPILPACPHLRVRNCPVAWPAQDQGPGRVRNIVPCGCACGCPGRSQAVTRSWFLSSQPLTPTSLPCKCLPLRPSVSLSHGAAEGPLPSCFALPVEGCGRLGHFKSWDHPWPVGRRWDFVICLDFSPRAEARGQLPRVHVLPEAVSRSCC